MGRVTQTASGAVATFKSPGRVPINSLKAYFAFVREGEGTPAPDNVRPLTGWTGVNVYHTRKNILNPNAERTRGNFTADGNIASAGNTYVFGIAVKPGTYVLSNKGTGVSYRVGLTKLYPKQGVYVNYLATRSNSADPYVITVASGWNYIALATTASVENVALTMIESGSTASEYEPYKGESFPVSWESFGTAYNGYVDLVQGKVVSERRFEVLDGVTNKVTSFSTAETSHGYGINFNGAVNVAKYTSTTVLACWSSHFNSGTYSHRGDRGSDLSIYLATANGALRIRYDAMDSEDEPIAAFNAWLAEQYANGTPVTVLYTLRTNDEYDLDPMPLRSLIGSNSIWSDAGDVEVNYDYAEPVEMLRIRERAAWGGYKPNEWDYIILPTDGSESGVFKVTKIPMTKGQTAVVQFEGIGTRASGHMIVDGYFAGATFVGDCITNGQTTTLFQANKLTDSSGEFTITASKAGTITIGQSRTATEGSPASYSCRSIKVRLN